MNKREAKEMVHRLASYLLEQYVQSREPDTYDPLFAASGVEGHRLSEADQDRFDEAFDALVNRLNAVGDRVYADMKLPRRERKREFPRADGKPGPRWKKHAERLRRWGWR